MTNFHFALWAWLLLIPVVHAEMKTHLPITVTRSKFSPEQAATGAAAHLPDHPALFAAKQIQTALKREAPDTVSVTLDLDPSLGEQAFRVIREGQSITVTGGAARGVMYGGLEVAERIRLNTLDTLSDQPVEPYLLRRGIKFNIPLDARTPSFADNGEAAQRNIAEMWNWAFWTEFLDTMALHRFNTLTLWNPHPFPTMTRIPGYEDTALNDVAVCTLDLATQRDQWGPAQLVSHQVMNNLKVIRTLTIEEKIEFWRKVMRYGRNRGIDFYFITWNICANTVALPVSPDYNSWEMERASEKPGKYGITHQIDNPETLAYYRQAVKTFVLTYPDLTGLGITAGENMPPDEDGVSPTREQWLWEAYGLGILDAKKVQPERSIRFIHRVWYSDMDKIMAYWGQYPDPFEVSFKYAKARLYSSPAIPFADSLVEDLKPYGLKSWWNLRNDDIFVHRWGDPEYVRSFLQNFPRESTAGYHMGSDGYVWGREFVTRSGTQAAILEISKHWYRFMLWGRLGYDPTLDQSFFTKVLADRYPETNVEDLFEAWRQASMIIPLVNQFHWRDWDFMWAVEGSKGGAGYRSIEDFYDNPTMDGSGHLNPKAYVEAVLADEPVSGSTPLNVADRLDELAKAALIRLESLTSEPDTELSATLGDIKAMALLGHYYAQKIRATVSLGFYSQTKEKSHREEMINHLQKGLICWNAYTELNASRYRSQFLARAGQLDWSVLREDAQAELKNALEPLGKDSAP